MVVLGLCIRRVLKNEITFAVIDILMTQSLQAIRIVLTRTS